MNEQAEAVRPINTNPELIANDQTDLVDPVLNVS